MTKLFESGSEGRSWLNLSLEESAQAIGEPIEKIAKALDWLESHGDIVVKPSQVRKRFRRLKDADASIVRELSEKMASVFEGREERDVARLEGVVSFLGSENCLTIELLAYFGEQDALCCGKCSSCLGRSAQLPAREYSELSLEDLELIQAVMAERQAALRNARQIARFLCGIASPASAGARLKQHRAYGIFSDLPFLEVFSAVQALGKHRI